MPKRYPNNLERYAPIPEGMGCWIWEGFIHDNGYGRASIGGRGMKQSAHRLFYEAHKGPIPEGMCVCHKCDTPLCVNPDHLFLGTTLDNNRDRAKKGRYFGEWNGRSKLTDADVIAIRESTLSLSEIAAKYGIAYQTASEIRVRRRWKHLGANAK